MNKALEFGNKNSDGSLPQKAYESYDERKGVVVMF